MKKVEAGLCVWEETSKMRKLGMTRRKKRRPVCVERNEEEEEVVVVVVVLVVVRAAQWTRCLPVSRAGPVGPHTHSPRPTCAPLYTWAGNPWLLTLTLVSILQYLFKWGEGGKKHAKELKSDLLRISADWVTYSSNISSDVVTKVWASSKIFSLYFQFQSYGVMHYWVGTDIILSFF